ncbi:titin homolog [Littorina saxatilis]|uniref:Uncharacterized protein n=1 Tax=Littorina saxatilis TaxID=31220 RepID=A0AAN9ARN2_9CAEN
MPPARGRGGGARGGQQMTRTQARTLKRAAAATPEKNKTSEDAEKATETISTEKEIDGSGQDVQMQVSDEPEEPGNEAEREHSADNVAAEMESTALEVEADGTQSRSELEEGECSSMEEDGDNPTSFTEQIIINDDDVIVDNAERKEPDDVIIIDDDSNAEEPASKTKKKDKTPMWRVRVCPVPFDDFCHMDDHFQKMMRQCQSFEFRMSKLLLHQSVKDVNKMLHFQSKSDHPWQPGALPHKDIITSGMVEMKVEDASLVELVHSARRAKFSQLHTMRFELKRLSEEEALMTDEQEDTEHADNGGQAEENTKTLIKNSSSQDPSAAQELLVNFAVRPDNSSTGGNAVRSDSGTQEESKEDSYLFVRKVPDQVPDNVLKAVFLTDMVDRQRGENSTGTATFDLGCPVVAEKSLWHYVAVLVNLEVLELATSTSQGTDAVEKDDTTEWASITKDQEDVRKMYKTVQGMMEVCKAEILKALPKSAIPDTPDAAGTEGGVQVSAAEKAASEKANAETSEKTNAESQEKTMMESSEKLKTETSVKEKMETSDMNSGKDTSEQGEGSTKKSFVRFPESLKVQEATKLINDRLSKCPSKKSSNVSMMFSPFFLPKEMQSDPDWDCTPYCDIHMHAYKQPRISEEESACPMGPMCVPLKIALNLENMVRAQIAMASFQDLATCALAEILKKDDLGSDDLTSLKHIVDGLHRSTLTMGGSALVFVADMRLLRRDAYLVRLNASNSKKLSLRLAPFEGAGIFGGKEKEAESVDKTAQQNSAEEVDKGGPAKSSESSKAVPASPQKDLKKDKDSKTEEKEPENKVQDKKAKEDSQSKATMEECRLEIARVLRELACQENPESDTTQEEVVHGDGNAASPDLKSHEILQLVEVLNSLLSAPGFNASSFVQATALPLRYWYWGTHYKAVTSLFEGNTRQQECLRGFGIKAGDQGFIVFNKKMAIQVEKIGRSLTALACFMERASYALKLLSEQDEVSIADVESMRRLVKGLSLRAPIAVGETILTAASLQVTRRITFVNRMLFAPEGAKMELIKGPLGSGGLFGPNATTVSNRYRKQMAKARRMNEEKTKRPAPGPRRGRAGVAAKRLQGAYRGVPRGGKLLHQPSRGAYPGGSRGATRGSLRGGKFDARRGGRPGSSRGGQQRPPRRGGNVSRQGPRNVNWAGSANRGQIPSLLELEEIPRGAGPREPDRNIQAVHAGIQAQMQAAQRELMMLQEQARLTQAQIMQERELLQNYDQGPFYGAREAPYQREVRHDEHRQPGRNNRPSGQQYFREKGPARRRNRNRNR